MNRTTTTIALLVLAGCRTPGAPGEADASPADTADSYREAHDTWDPGPADTAEPDTGSADTGTEYDPGPAALQARPDAVDGVSQVAWVGGGGTLDGWACDGLEVWASRDHDCATVLGLPAVLPPDAWLCADVVEAGEWGCIATLDGVAQVVTVRGR